MPIPDESEEKPQPPAYAFGVSLLAVGAFFILFASRIKQLGFVDENDPGPRALPIILSSVLLLGGSFELCKEWWRTRQLDVGLLFGMLLLYLFAVPLFGFRLSTFLLAATVMGLLEARWWVALLAAAALLVVVQLLFVQMFRVQLPAGRLGEWFQTLSVSTPALHLLPTRAGSA